MGWAHCFSTATTERSDRTADGYRRFNCWECGRGFNERTGSVRRWCTKPDLVVFGRASGYRGGPLKSSR